MRVLLTAAVAVFTVSFIPLAATAMPVVTAVKPSANIVPIRDGCGGGRYRGPGGYCHWFGRGPYPNGFYGPPGGGPGWGWRGPGWRGPGWGMGPGRARWCYYHPWRCGM